MQKYPDITESSGCILQIFIAIFLLPIISFGICSTPELSKIVTLSLFAYKLSNEFLLIYTHQD